MLLLQESHLNHVKKSTLSELLRVNVAQASSNSEYALCNSMAITVLMVVQIAVVEVALMDVLSLSAKFAMSLAMKRAQNCFSEPNAKNYSMSDPHEY
jgi:hypothetical protein